MLQEDIKTPVLFFAMDTIFQGNITTAGALSIQNTAVTEREIAEKTKYVEKYKAADIYQHLSRVAIPINDKLMPIHYSGGTASQSHFVDYLDTGAVMTKSGNIVVLRFEIKNSLSALSTVADLILGLATKDFFTSNQPRISFFSPNLCVFNAYLRGISRSIVSDTDKEVISIVLEVAPNRVEVDVEDEVPKANETLANNSLINTADKTPTQMLSKTESFAQIEAEQIDFSYNWYRLFSVDEINKIQVPDFKPVFTIERKSIRFMRVNSVDANSQARNMITVGFKQEFTVLKSTCGQVLNEKYGMMIFDDVLYFGIKNAN